MNWCESCRTCSPGPAFHIISGAETTRNGTLSTRLSSDLNRLRAVPPLPSSDSIVPSAEIERGSVGRVENGRMGDPRSVLYYHWRVKEGLLAVYDLKGQNTNAIYVELCSVLMQQEEY